MSDTAEGAVQETRAAGIDANCPVPSSAYTVDVDPGSGDDGNAVDGAADEMNPQGTRPGVPQSVRTRPEARQKRRRAANGSLSSVPSMREALLGTWTGGEDQRSRIVQSLAPPTGFWAQRGAAQTREASSRLERSNGAADE